MSELLIGDPASIAREMEMLLPTVAKNLRDYGRLRIAARNFSDVAARSDMPHVLRMAWTRVDMVLKEIKEGG